MVMEQAKEREAKDMNGTGLISNRTRHPLYGSDIDTTVSPNSAILREINQKSIESLTVRYERNLVTHRPFHMILFSITC